MYGETQALGLLFAIALATTPTADGILLPHSRVAATTNRGTSSGDGFVGVCNLAAFKIAATHAFDSPALLHWARDSGDGAAGSGSWAAITRRIPSADISWWV